MGIAGLILHENPTSVSNSGLIVDPKVAQRQIDAESRVAEEIAASPDGSSTVTDPAVVPVGDGLRKPSRVPPMPTIVTRFHGTKTLDPMRAVRDISQISDEILALFTVNGVPIKITVDIESSAVEKLSADEVAALKENLNTLGFSEWNIE